MVAGADVEGGVVDEVGWLVVVAVPGADVEDVDVVGIDMVGLGLPVLGAGVGVTDATGGLGWCRCQGGRRAASAAAVPTTVTATAAIAPEASTRRRDSLIFIETPP
jgi:hypothetical protein